MKLGKKGQVSIPKAVLRQVGISGERTLLVDVADDGAIVLRQAGVYPIEIYSDERVREFDDADKMTPEEATPSPWLRRASSVHFAPGATGQSSLAPSRVFERAGRSRRSLNGAE